jgi:hypothetical protein
VIRCRNAVPMLMFFPETRKGISCLLPGAVTRRPHL